MSSFQPFSSGVATPMGQMGKSSGLGSRAPNRSHRGGRGSEGRGQGQTSRGQARVFTLTRQDAQASNAVVTGILPIDSQNAHVLFDSGATYFFISTFFATTLGRDPSPLGEFLIVATPMGHSLLANSVYKSCEILLEGKSFMED